MALMYDRMVANGVMVNGTKQSMDESFSDGDAQIFDIQNVADYFHSHVFTEDRSWTWTDFPNVAPPFESVWAEFELTEKHFQDAPLGRRIRCRAGLHCTSIDVDQSAHLLTQSGKSLRQAFTELCKTGRSEDLIVPFELPESLDERQKLVFDFMLTLGVADRTSWSKDQINNSFGYRVAVATALREYVPIRWVIAVSIFLEPAGSMAAPLGLAQIFVRADGSVYSTTDGMTTFSLLYNANDLEDSRTYGEQMLSSVFMPVLLSFSFLHCRNVTTDVIQPAPLLRQQRRHGVKPFVQYKVLDIEPMKRVLRTEGESEKTGLKKALHICRGHFAHYSEEKPLFGRIAGTVWRPSHVRGSVDEGIVDKDYRVKGPKS